LHKIATAFVTLLFVASAAYAQPPAPSVTRMGNGLTVILQEDHAAELVGIDVWVKAGSGFESTSNNGVSHYIEHLLFGGTRKRQAGDMDREMESLGATLDAHTGADYTHFSTTVSSRYLSKALDIFADAVNDSQFRDADVERERFVILDEIARKQTNPTTVCRALLAKRLYGDHPYALPLEGTPDTVRKIKRDDLLGYYHRYYVPSNIAIVLVGDFDQQNAISEIGRLFQGAPAAAPVPIDKPAMPRVTKQVNASVKASFESDYLAIGFLGPPASDTEDVCAMDVLLTYLGLGYRSWISEELKAKSGLVREGSADFITQRDQGLVSIIAAGTSANLPKAKDAVFAKLAAVRTKGMSLDDIDRAKRSLLGQSAFQCETVSGRADTYGFYYAASDPAFAAKYAACVGSVTNDAIVKVASKYLSPDAAVVITIGPDQEDSK
jgi:zinc protease